MFPQFRKIHRPHQLQLPTELYNISNSVMSKVLERLVSVHLDDSSRNAVVYYQPQLFTYRKGLGACDTLLCVSHTLQSSLGSAQETRIELIDLISSAFDRVNHEGILYKLYSAGIVGYV